MIYVANQRKICIEVIYSQDRSCKNFDNVLPMFLWLWFYYVVFVS